MLTRADTPPSPSRRRALSVLINGFALIAGGAVSALLGVFVARPAAREVRERWVRAGPVTDLVPDMPVARVLSVPANDGWYRVRSRRTVFLIWDGSRGVRAFSATCTHLGCQVRWDDQARQFQCPCHGGRYDADGRVLAGPPPRPLDRVEVRLDAADNSVLVQL